VLLSFSNFHIKRQLWIQDWFCQITIKQIEGNGKDIGGILAPSYSIWYSHSGANTVFVAASIQFGREFPSLSYLCRSFDAGF